MLTVNQRVTIGFDFEQLMVTTSVQVLTPTRYKNASTVGGASEAFVSIETGDIRVTYDGTTPTSTVGHLFKKDQSFRLVGQNQMSQFKCYQDTGSAGSAIISITYERE